MYGIHTYLSSSDKINLLILIILLSSSICSLQAQTFNIQDDSSIVVSVDDADSKDTNRDHEEKVKHCLLCNYSKRIIPADKTLNQNEKFERTDYNNYFSSINVNPEYQSFLLTPFTSFISHCRKTYLFDYDCMNAIAGYDLIANNSEYIMNIGFLKRTLQVESITLVLVRDRSPGKKNKQSIVNQYNHTNQSSHQEIQKHYYYQPLRTRYLINHLTKLLLENHINNLNRKKKFRL